MWSIGPFYVFDGMVGGGPPRPCCPITQGGCTSGVQSWFIDAGQFPAVAKHLQSLLAGPWFAGQPAAAPQPPQPPAPPPPAPQPPPPQPAPQPAAAQPAATQRSRRRWAFGSLIAGSGGFTHLGLLRALRLPPQRGCLENVVVCFWESKNCVPKSSQIIPQSTPRTSFFTSGAQFSDRNATPRVRNWPQWPGGFPLRGCHLGLYPMTGWVWAPKIPYMGMLRCFPLRRHHIGQLAWFEHQYIF